MLKRGITSPLFMESLPREQNGNFLKLKEKHLQIDIEIYPIQQCDKILGILSSMVAQKA